MNLLERGGLDRLTTADATRHVENDQDTVLEEAAIASQLEIWRSLRGGGGLLAERSPALNSFEAFLARHLEVARARPL